MRQEQEIAGEEANMAEELEKPQRPSRHGLAWSAEEERKLYDAFAAGKSFADCAQEHQRTVWGIKGCLQKLGVLDEDGYPVSPRPDFAPSQAAQKRIARAEKLAAKEAKKAARAAKSSQRRKAEDEAAKAPEMSEAFLRALDLMENTDRNVFITGRAGTGKSTLLSHFCRVTDKQPVVLAPTGVAALNVRGQTIHRFFNFYVDVTPQRLISQKHKKLRNAKLYKSLRTIIIDEISMVRADLLDCVDTFMRLHGPDAAMPFGGAQMIFVGDLFQLPPVVGQQEKQIFSSHYETPYFFSAKVLQRSDFEIVEMDKVYRQKDDSFVAILNRIRDNSAKESDIATINSRLEAVERPSQPPTSGKSEFSITLTTTNAVADAANSSRLDALKGELMFSEARISGDFGREYFPTLDNLAYKIGAQIMMLNNDNQQRWVNGSIGVITAIKRDEIPEADEYEEEKGEDEESENGEYLEVRLQDSGETVEVRPHTWEVFRFGLQDGAVVSAPAGTFTQYPFRLAWAITIHKSQGKTFRRMTLDIGNGAFAAGQLYVALSRCASLEGLTLKKPISTRDISTDPRIFDFFAAKSKEPENNDGLIRKAAAERIPLAITYMKSDGEIVDCRVIPLRVGISSYRGEQYESLRAFSDEHQKELNLRIDRILKAVKT